jgi:hypothetical protein
MISAFVSVRTLWSFSLQSPAFEALRRTDRCVAGIAVIRWRFAEQVPVADCRWPTARSEEVIAAM